jgi:transcriptional regulator with XRE-family HTH domain
LTRENLARKLSAVNPQIKSRKKLSATDVRNLRTLLLLSVFDSQAIGDRIAQARNETGLTQEEIADLVGVSTRSWQGYEAGDVVPYRHMRRIEEVTRRSVVWILHGGEALETVGEQRLREIVREEIEAALGRGSRSNAA